MGDDSQLQLRWHSHSLTFVEMLQDLHAIQAFSDVTLNCDGGCVRAHRAVLSACSPYLASILRNCNDHDDTPLLLPETPVDDVKFIISFIYKGQVDVPQDQLNSFLGTAKHLQILALEQGDKIVDSPEKSEEISIIPDIQTTIQQAHENNNRCEVKLKEDIGNEIEIEKREVKVEHIKLEPKAESPAQENQTVNLNYYLQQAIQSASMPCPLCNKEFKSQSGLRDHIRLHTGERPFICDYCKMNFARASHLKRHRRMHTGEKPFECNICSKEFSRGDKLKDHVRRHQSDDKLNQIRKQILHLDDMPDSDTRSEGSPAYVTASAVMTAYGPRPPVFNPENNLSRLQILRPKTELQQDNPTNNRLCVKTPQGPAMSQGVGVLQSLQTLQSFQGTENLIPQMLGVTNIGECVLKPINDIPYK